MLPMYLWILIFFTRPHKVTNCLVSLSISLSLSKIIWNDDSFFKSLETQKINGLCMFTTGLGVYFLLNFCVLCRRRDFCSQSTHCWPCLGLWALIIYRYVHTKSFWLDWSVQSLYCMISSAEQYIHVWMLFGFRSCVVCWCLDRGANTTQPTPTGSPSVCVSCSVPSHSLVLLPCIRVSNSVCVWYKVSSSPVALLFLRVNLLPYRSVSGLLIVCVPWSALSFYIYLYMYICRRQRI